MGYFPVRYDSSVVIYECKMFIRLATDHTITTTATCQLWLENPLDNLSFCESFEYLDVTNCVHMLEHFLPY